MALIEDYGLIGDLQTAALVSRHGCIDWLCLPRFDSGAIFAALLGDSENGHWTIQPEGEFHSPGRSYRGDTLVLETELETPTGAVRLIDFMPPRGKEPDLIRIVEGIRGRVDMVMELVLRFDYGSIVPWVRTIDGTLVGIAGPDAVSLRTPVELEGRNLHTYAEFMVEEGDRVPFVLTWTPSHEPLPEPVDAEHALAETIDYWEEWIGRCTAAGALGGALRRSLLTLKALTYAPTGGIVAAPTTSLPEALGGVRNWDYRYCWLRDATLTLLAFLRAGYIDEARAWRDWLLRAIAGSPEDIQVMYGVAGERRLIELELPWLAGYEGSQPVRIGNGAAGQLQLDVYGEVVDALHMARRRGLEASDPAWALTRKVFDWLESALEGAGSGHLGGARPAQALHALEGHGLGRVRPRREVDRATRARGPARPLARDEGCDPRRRPSQRVQRRAGLVRPVLRLGPTRREPPSDSARRLPARDRRARARNGRGDPAGPHA